MKLVVISPESEFPGEHTVLVQLFEAGLERLHVRKPHWPRERLATWLREIPPAYRSCIVLHQHHELAAEFDLGGVHFKDTPISSGLGLARKTGFTSGSCHDLATLTAAFGRHDALFFSPVFPSISKPGYRPMCDRATIAARLVKRTEEERKTEVIALGGITPENAAHCAELGFDGVAVLGALWHAAAPCEVFDQIQQSIAAYAAGTA